MIILPYIIKVFRFWYRLSWNIESLFLVISLWVISDDLDSSSSEMAPIFFELFRGIIVRSAWEEASQRGAREGLAWFSPPQWAGKPSPWSPYLSARLLNREKESRCEREFASLRLKAWRQLRDSVDDWLGTSHTLLWPFREKNDRVGHSLLIHQTFIEHLLCARCLPLSWWLGSARSQIVLQTTQMGCRRIRSVPSARSLWLILHLFATLPCFLDWPRLDRSFCLVLIKQINNNLILKDIWSEHFGSRLCQSPKDGYLGIYSAAF